MNGDGGDGSSASDSDEGGETWAPLPPEEEDGETSPVPRWDFLLEGNSSLASNEEQGLPGVKLSSRALSTRSRLDMVMGLNAVQNYETASNNHPPDARLEDLASPMGSPTMASAAENAPQGSHDVSELTEGESDSEEELRGFHRPESASPTVTNTHSFSEIEEEGETLESEAVQNLPRQHQGTSNERGNHHPSHRRGSTASMAESIRSNMAQGSRKLTAAPSIKRTASNRGSGPPSPSPLLHDENATLLEICRRGHHTAQSVKRAEALLADDKGSTKSRDPNGKMPLHLLCEAPGHTKFSVELLTLILKAHKSGAKQTVANVRNGGLLPIHLLCSNVHVTEHSEAVLRVVLHANEDGVEKGGGKEGHLPITMLCRGRKMTAGTFMMLKRLVEAHKESVKEKNAAGRTLMHELCYSTKACPHTEHSIAALHVILDVYKRGPEIADNKGLRPLHALCLSEELTVHSVAMCKMLLDKSESVAQAQDEHGMLAVHHLCAREKLSEHSLEVLRKVLEVYEKGAQAKDDEGRVPLHWICGTRALSKVSVDMTRQLLLAHKQAFSVADRQGRLPLHVLMCSMSPERKGVEFGEEILDQLLWTDKSAVETQDEEGRLPLHELCASGLSCPAEISMLDKLLSYGREGASQPDKAGNIPLHLLCESKPHSEFTSEGFLKLRQVLRDTPRDPTEPAAGPGPPPAGDAAEAPDMSKDHLGAMIKGHGGKLALHSLCAAGSHTAESVKIFGWLVEENVHGVGHKDSAGMTPLHWLCSAWGHTVHSERIFEQLQTVFSLQVEEKLQQGKVSAEERKQLSELKTKDGLLPLHILCGAGKHTDHSYNIYEKLVQAHPESVRVRTTLSQVSMNSFMPASLHCPRRHDDDLVQEEENPDPDEEGSERGPAFPMNRVPLHFLCGSSEHTPFSVKICHGLLALFKEAVFQDDDDDLLPLHLLCTSTNLTSFSVEICSLVVEAYETLKKEITDDDENDLRPLLYVCQCSSLSEHSVAMCELLLKSLEKPASVQPNGGVDTEPSSSIKVFPLHDLCGTEGHTNHSVEICKQLLKDHKDWAKIGSEDGKLPLHVLCECENHTESSVEICRLLLDAYPDGIQVPASSCGCLPIHLLCCNPTLTAHSCDISKRLLAGAGGETAGAVCDLGWTPLHHLCNQELKSASHVTLVRQLLVKYPQACSVKPVDSKPDLNDVNLPLHQLCRAERHTKYSVEVCSFLVMVNKDAVSQVGNQIEDETMMDEEDITGDLPLMMVVKGDKLNSFSAKMVTMLVEDPDELADPLTKLAQKVYRPKGDEMQQRMALRIMISLAFIEPAKVLSYITLDESQNGAHSISFMKEVVDELGFDAENPLHHVLRAGQLYKTLAEHETASVLVARLSKLSDVHVTWAAEIVEALPGKVAKRAIWTPEKDSDEFMNGDSPIGIALELGDLKIVSHGAVFDVVKEAWPGEYRFQYNPFSGSIYNNLILEYAHSTSAGKGQKGARVFKWTWEQRLLELADPEKLNGSPMAMYWLGIFFQTTFLCVFHIVVENSAFANGYLWSLGPASWYLILHVTGGILFELGQLAGDGLVGYSQDPWNVVDVSMYSLLTIWLVFRVSDAEQAAAAGETEFIPESSISGEFLGLAAIFIWLRMLNVFGLDQKFGPLVRIIQGMVSNVFSFMVLLTVFLAGFATCLKSIFKRMDTDSEEFEDSEFPFDSFSDQQVAMLSLLDMALGQFELVSVFEVSSLAFWVTFFFLAATFIMLFNLLIALMTDTYATIRTTSEQLWKKDRAMLMAAYTRTEKMSNNVNLGGVLTALPQPLNLPVVTSMLILTPFYLPWKLRSNPRGKGWQKLVNQLQKRVVDALLFVIVCVPFCVIFIFLILPLNWIFVASSGLLEYLGLDLKSVPSFIKNLLSQILGIIFCPVIFAGALILTPLFLLHRELSKLCRHSRDTDMDSTHADLSIYRLPSEGTPEAARLEQKRGSLFGNFQLANAFRGSLVEDGGDQESARMSDGTMINPSAAAQGHAAAHFNGDQKQQASRIGSEKVWEQHLDDDDVSALKAAHKQTMPIDNTGEEDAAEVVENKEDAALQEVRAELAKKMATLDGNQRTLLQTTRDLQIESKAAQQETATSITKLETKVFDLSKESSSVAKSYEQKLEALKRETDLKIQKVAELLFYQAEAQQQAFKLQDHKINLLLESMGYDEADAVNMSIPHTPHQTPSFAHLWGSLNTPSPSTLGPHKVPSTESVMEEVGWGHDHVTPRSHEHVTPRRSQQGTPRGGHEGGEWTPRGGGEEGEEGGAQREKEEEEKQGKEAGGAGGEGELAQAEGRKEGEEGAEEKKEKKEKEAEGGAREAGAAAVTQASAPMPDKVEPRTAMVERSQREAGAERAEAGPTQEERPTLDVSCATPGAGADPKEAAKLALLTAPGASFKGSVMERLFARVHPTRDHAKKAMPKIAAKKPALQALEEHMTESQLQTKTQMEKLSAQISALAPSLDMLKQVIEVQDSSSRQVQRLQEKLSEMEPALGKLDSRLEQAEQAAAASSGELRGSLALLNPQIRALETHLSAKQQESSAAIMKQMEERMASVSVKSEQGTKELLRAWEQKVEAIQKHTDTRQEQLQKVVEERLRGLTTHVEERNEMLLHMVEDKVERTVAQSSAEMSSKMAEQGHIMEEQVTRMAEQQRSEVRAQIAQLNERMVETSATVARNMAEQSHMLEEQVTRMAEQQRSEMRAQITTLDERVIEEITRLDARVKAEVQDMSKRTHERMETQMGTVMETLEAKITDTYDQLKEEQTSQLNTLHAAIARIPPPKTVEVPAERGPRFTWSDHLGAPGSEAGAATSSRSRTLSSTPSQRR